MENILVKVQELGNYCLSVSNNEDKKYIINSVLLNNNKPHNLMFVKLLRVENDSENKSLVQKDISGNEIIVHKFSQINEFINIFGLLNNEEVRNKLKEYLDYFISVKDSINLDL
jgi:hypothetical protein